MIKVFAEGKDLYSEVASMVYGVPYEDCTEFKNGVLNLEGKKRRTSCKSLILGLQYGRGIKSIADQIKPDEKLPTTKEDIARAKKLSEDFFHHYPKAKEWMEGNYKKAREIGYVEDLWGRRRRLPDASLPKYQFSLLSGDTQKVNPLLGTSNKKLEPTKAQIAKYTAKLEQARSKEGRDIVTKEAEKEGIKINCNSGFIAQAERQAINAPIQGGSASMAKLAMRNMTRDKRLKELDFHLLIPVHDEIIGEAPLWNIEEVKERVEDIMVHAGEPECKVPMKCDCISFDYWYQDQAEGHIKEDYHKLLNEGKTKDQAYAELLANEYSEFSPEVILKVINEN